LLDDVHEGVAEGVGVGVAEGVGVGVGVGVADGVGVGEGVGVAEGVGEGGEGIAEGVGKEESSLFEQPLSMMANEPMRQASTKHGTRSIAGKILSSLCVKKVQCLGSRACTHTKSCAKMA